MSNEGEKKEEVVVQRATVIDWTDPGTRKKEYERIDKRMRGWRGFWRKITCGMGGGKGDIQFWDEKKEKEGDGGSVRRYRLDIEEKGTGGMKEEGAKDGRKGGRGAFRWLKGNKERGS
jgi:hypothetical protein